MVVIRLQRRGTKKTPHHRIVVTDRARAQSGRVLESVGFYDPSFEPPKFSLDESRLAFWVSSGAQVSNAVGLLLKRFKRISVAAATKS
jgi:small subunit ribosomal protein S16